MKSGRNPSGAGGTLPLRDEELVGHRRPHVGEEPPRVSGSSRSFIVPITVVWRRARRRIRRFRVRAAWIGTSVPACVRAVSAAAAALARDMSLHLRWSPGGVRWRVCRRRCRGPRCLGGPTLRGLGSTCHRGHATHRLALLPAFATSVNMPTALPSHSSPADDPADIRPASRYPTPSAKRLSVCPPTVGRVLRSRSLCIEDLIDFSSAQVIELNETFSAGGINVCCLSFP